MLTWNYTTARRYDEAISQSKRTLELDPNDGYAREQVAWCYTLKGMYSEALAEYKKLGKPHTSPARLVYLYVLAWPRRCLRPAGP